MNQNLVRQIVKSKGWQHVLEVITEERDRLPVMDDTQSMVEKGRRWEAFELARKKINSIISKLEQIASEQEKKNISYK